MLRTNCVFASNCSQTQRDSYHFLNHERDGITLACHFSLYVAEPCTMISASSMNSRSKYQLYLFDFDGTLANTLPFFQGCFNQIADEFRFRQVQSHEWELLRDTDVASIMSHLQISRWKLPLIVRRFRQVMRQHAQDVNLFQGVVELFQKLESNGQKFAIVSSNSEENIQAILGSQLASKFQFILGGASLFGKAPKLKKALRKAKVHARDTIYIGDENRDADAAAEVGLDFGAVTYGYSLRENLLQKSPAFIFESVTHMSEQLSVKS